MTDVRHHARALLIAVAAVGVVLRPARDAWASSSTAPEKGARSCCLRRPSAGCCCARPAAAPRREPSESRAGLTLSGLGLATTPGLPCECRSDGPFTPAVKP